METLIQLLSCRCTAVLGDIDLAGRRTDVDEVAEVADAFWGAGIRGTIGHGDAEISRVAEDARSTDVKPRHAAIGCREDIAGRRADDDFIAVDRVVCEIGDTRRVHCGSGVGKP